MKIVLVRHGETTANHLKLIQGWTDNPLNDLGKQQAHEAGIFLKNQKYQPDLAYSSPLIRASKTGEIIIKYLPNIDNIHLDFHFSERNFGPFEGEVAIPTLEKVLVNDFSYPGYESDNVLINRVKLGLINLYKHYQGKEIIIFCHSHVIKSCLILAEPENYDFKTFIANGSLHRFHFSGDKIELRDFSFNIQE